MAITSSNYGRALELLKHPDLAPEKQAALQAAVSSYEQNVSSYGPPAAGEAPAAAPAASGPKEYPMLATGSGGIQGLTLDKQPGATTGGSGNNYFYEPSIDEAKKALSDPAQAAQVGATNLNPDLLNSLDEHSDPYRRFAEARYQAERNRAEGLGRHLERYQDIDAAAHPLDKALGFVGKYAPSLAEGAGSLFGNPLTRIQNVAGVSPQTLEAAVNADVTGGQAPPAQGEERDIHREPLAHFAGQMGGMLLGGGLTPAGAVAGGVTRALGEGGATALGRLAAGGAAGIAGNVAQSAVEHGASALPGGPEPQVAPGEAASQFMSQLPTTAAVGGAFGVAGQGIGELARSYLRNLNSSPTGQTLRDLREAGGNTHVLTGVTAPESLQQNIAKSLAPGEVRSPMDLAAEKVAPQIHAATQRDALENVQRIAKQTEDYYASPEGQALHSTGPAIDQMLDLAKQGSFESPLTGQSRAPDPGRTRVLRDEIKNFSDQLMVPAEHATELAQHVGGRALDASTAQQLLGLDVPPGKAAIIVPAKVNARTVTAMEDKIYERLGFARNATGKDDPLWRGINQGFKNVRDQFGYSLDRTPRSQQVPGHDYPGVSRGAPGPSEPPPSSRPSTPTEVGSMAPDAQSEADQYEFATGPTQRAKFNGNDTAQKATQWAEQLMAQGRGARLREAQRMALLGRETPQLPQGGTEPSVLEQGATVAPKQLGMGERSAAAAYPPEELAPNAGTYEPKQILKQLTEGGGIESAAKLGKGMRSLDEAAAPYEGKSPQEATAIANSLEHPVELALDGGNATLRDGRHRLEAARAAGAESILARVRVYRPDGKAEEVGVMPVPIASNADKATAREVGSPPAPPGKPGASPQLGGAKGVPSLPEAAGPDAAGVARNTRGPQLTAKLDDGTVVTGFSALRRLQHLAQDQLESTSKATGGDSLEGVTKKVIGFKSGEGGRVPTDLALQEQARRLNLEPELQEVAGTNAYRRLHAQAWGQGKQGVMHNLFGAAALRMEPVARYLSEGVDNPFAGSDNSPTGRIQRYMLEQRTRDLLNATQGAGGYKAGELQRLVQAEQEKQQKESR